MIHPEILPPRTVSAPAGAVAGRFRPWYEVSALVEASIAAWDWRAVTWQHVAIPAVAGEPHLAGARSFDPGRRAAAPGAPPGVPAPSLDATIAADLARRALAGLDRAIYRHPQLGLVSGLGEDRVTFRRRCLAAFGPALRHGSLRGGEGAATVAAFAQAIESRQLEAGELLARVLRVGVGWYPAGVEPLGTVTELLVSGPVRNRSR